MFQYLTGNNNNSSNNNNNNDASKQTKQTNINQTRTQTQMQTQTRANTVDLTQNDGIGSNDTGSIRKHLTIGTKRSRNKWNKEENTIAHFLVSKFQVILRSYLSRFEPGMMMNDWS